MLQRPLGDGIIQTLTNGLTLMIPTNGLTLMIPIDDTERWIAAIDTGKVICEYNITSIILRPKQTAGRVLNNVSYIELWHTGTVAVYDGRGNTFRNYDADSLPLFKALSVLKRQQISVECDRMIATMFEGLV
jgi:hypothetical protein